MNTIINLRSKWETTNLLINCCPSYVSRGRSWSHVCGGKKSASKLFWKKGKGSIRIPRRKWYDNIKMNVQEILWKSLHCLYVAQDKGDWKVFVNTVMNHRFHKIAVISWLLGKHQLCGARWMTQDGEAGQIDWFIIFTGKKSFTLLNRIPLFS